MRRESVGDMRRKYEERIRIIMMKIWNKRNEDEEDKSMR